MHNNKSLDYEKTMKIYEIHTNSISKYNTIIWQFPTAYITLNAIAINFFLEKKYLLLVLVIIDFVLLHSVFKHIHNQSSIIKALKNIEGKLHSFYPNNFIPHFATNNKILKIRTALLSAYTLLIINIILLLYVLYTFVCK